MDLARVSQIVEAARGDGRDALLEGEGLEVLAAVGIETPAYISVPQGQQLTASQLAALRSDDVVVKVVSPSIAHKSDVGGVAFARNELNAVRAVIQAMEDAFAGADVRGYLVQERVMYDASLGGELLFGVRWTNDFGAVLAFGTGGIYTEFLAQHFRPGYEIALAAPDGLDAQMAEELIRRAAIAGLVTEKLRGHEPRLTIDTLVATFLKFAELAKAAVPSILSELEVNPFAVSAGRLVALDVFGKCGLPAPPRQGERPLQKLRNLLEPRSIAIVGVSDRMNPGRVILLNIIKADFNRERIFVVKPESDSIEGCACYPDVRSLPEAVDLLVLAVAAHQVPSLLGTAIAEEKAESVIIIPGGLEEKTGSEDTVARINAAIERARASAWGGPVIVGGNSMGIRSGPGHYDATLIPAYKLPAADFGSHPVALIAQSGAFCVAKSSKLGGVPRYMISIGNQMDLTIGDYLAYLEDDPEIEIYAVYTEGFRPLDGLKFIRAVERITAKGKPVMLHRAGRTPEGAAASASHTAAIAGEYAVTRELARRAGAIVCESIGDFEDLVRLFALLGSKPVRGVHLGALSNAGFESVVMADHVGAMKLAEFSRTTLERLRALFKDTRVDTIVDIRNPIDVTPMMSDAAFAEAVRIIMQDENVDVGIVGCVPLTPALQTLPPGEGHPEDVFGPDSIATRLVRLKAELEKPWVAVVDGGHMYDPLTRLLEENGIATFRSADRALRLLGIWAGWQLLT